MSHKALASTEQTAYANLLFYGCWIGLATMIITYAIYVFGIVEPHIPVHEVSLYWGKSVHNYLGNANVPTGWGWVSLLGTGDFINFIGVIILAGMTLVCYLRIIPILLRQNDKLMVGIAILEVIVLAVAASGIFGSGGH